MKKVLIWIISLILFSWVGLLLAANQLYFWYWVSNTLLRATLNSSSATVSTSVSKVEEWWVCKAVTSTDSRLLFIPTRTSAERSTFITNKPSHIALWTCGCTTNADCGAWNICSWYVAGAWYCDGEFEYTTDWYCQYIGREWNICNGIIDEVLCNNQTEYTLHTSFREYLPACARVQGGEPGGTAYCGQEFRTQSECTSAPSPCTWVNWTATPWTCIVCGVWGAWSACSVTCGWGTQSRIDNCGNTQSQSCNTQACGWWWMVGPCGSCASTSECPVNYYCNKIYDQCWPSDGELSCAIN